VTKWRKKHQHHGSGMISGEIKENNEMKGDNVNVSYEMMARNIKASARGTKAAAATSAMAL